MLLGQLFQSIEAWRKLSAIPLKPKVAYKILKYTKYVSAEHDVAEKQRIALIREITNTAEGEDAQIKPGSPEFVKYVKSFNEIMATEISFEQIKLNLEDVIELLDEKPDSLTANDLAMLEPFFCGYEGEFRNEDGTPKTELDGGKGEPDCEVCGPGPECARSAS